MEKNKIKIRWNYLYYFPYIVLMGTCYILGVTIAAFEAFFTFFVNRDEYYNTFIYNESNFRRIFLSMFDY